MPTRAHPALLHLRRHLRGLMQVGERLDGVRFVIDNATGRCVLPVHPDSLLQAAPEDDTLTLHIADDADEQLHLLVHADRLDPARDESCDRYLIYFGPPKIETSGAKRPTPVPPAWLALRIEIAKFDLEMVEPGDLERPNPFRADESRACKALNANPSILFAACNQAGVDVAAPRAVGVDPWGIDIRAAFGIVRIELESAAATADEAIEMISH